MTVHADFSFWSLLALVMLMDLGGWFGRELYRWLKWRLARNTVHIHFGKQPLTEGELRRLREAFSRVRMTAKVTTNVQEDSRV